MSYLTGARTARPPSLTKKTTLERLSPGHQSDLGDHTHHSPPARLNVFHRTRRSIAVVDTGSRIAVRRATNDAGSAAQRAASGLSRLIGEYEYRPCPWNRGERSEQPISGCKRNAPAARCSWAMPWLQGQPRRMTLPLPLETSPISGASTSRLSTPGTSRTRRRASRLQLAGAPRARASSPAPHPAGQGPEPVAGGNLGRHVSRLRLQLDAP